MNWSYHNFIICYDSFLWLIANSLYLLSNHFIFAMLASHLTRLSNKFVFMQLFFYFRSVGLLWSTRVFKESFSRFENLLLIHLQGRIRSNISFSHGIKFYSVWLTRRSLLLIHFQFHLKPTAVANPISRRWIKIGFSLREWFSWYTLVGKKVDFIIFESYDMTHDRNN